MLNILHVASRFCLPGQAPAAAGQTSVRATHLIKDPATISCPASHTCSCYDTAFALFSPEGKMGSSKKGC